MKDRNITFGAILSTLACFGLLFKAQAVSPSPDGCYPNFTTAEGCSTLNLLTSGVANTGVGWRSLFSDSAGSFNTGVGAATMVLNTADSNTAVGAAALLLNTSGTENVAVGTAAMVFNNTSGFNTAVGAFALYNNVANDNTAIGNRSLFNNTTGDQNTAIGVAGCCGAALFSNTTGRFNTAVGGGALSDNTDGDDNTAVGTGTLQHNTGGNENVAVGLNALNNSNGNNNVALGNYAGFAANDGSNNIYIGYQIEGAASESNACYIGSIFGQTNNLGTAVFIDANNKLGTLTSSKRFKEAIQPMDKASDALFALKPVTFRYKRQIDPLGKSQFGLVAEEVEKINPNLVVHDKEGKPYSVRYDQVNAMLLNEFLKEHKTVQDQGATIAEFKKEIVSLTATVKEQAAQIQKVSTQVQLSKPAAKMVVNQP